jgi:hypothetical protein
VTQGWHTSESETSSGTVESRQWIGLSDPVVGTDEESARQLGDRYLEEVARVTRGLVRPRRKASEIALVLVGLIPLLRFGPAQVVVEANRVQCAFPITGGLLVARPGGSLVIAQGSTVEPELELVVAGYFPRLRGSTRNRSLRRALYSTLQARAHRAVSRRFLERAAGGRGS